MKKVEDNKVKIANQYHNIKNDTIVEKEKKLKGLESEIANLKMRLSDVKVTKVNNNNYSQVRRIKLNL